nr:MAG TPA: hypothetical protein [Caudoviricetes sp.]
MAYPSRLRSQRLGRWSMVKSGAFPFSFTI